MMTQTPICCCQRLRAKILATLLISSAETFKPQQQNKAKKSIGQMDPFESRIIPKHHRRLLVNFRMNWTHYDQASEISFINWLPREVLSLE